jgi:hypothetical protein
MIISEIDVEKYVQRTKKAQARDTKLSGGFTGKGGQIGEVLKMTEKHFAFWKHAVQKNPDVAKANPQGLLNAWIDKFYGTSSIKIDMKKAMNNEVIGAQQGKKGADVIFRIVTAILLKPKTEVEAKKFREQIVKHLNAEVQSDIGEPMPQAAQDQNPTAAQNQVGAKKTGSDGTEYEWKGAQWVGTTTGRMATKQISKELG